MTTHLRRLAALFAVILCSAAPAFAAPPKVGRKPQIRRLRRANLKISKIEMDYKYSSEFPSKRVFVTVKNAGNRTAGASSLQAWIRVDSSAPFKVWASVPALLPGQSARVIVESFPLSGPHLQKRTYRIYALADAKKQVSESNETDNMASGVFIR